MTIPPAPPSPPKPHFPPKPSPFLLFFHWKQFLVSWPLQTQRGWQVFMLCCLWVNPAWATVNHFNIKFSVSFFLSETTRGRTLPWSLIAMEPRGYDTNGTQILAMCNNSGEFNKASHLFKLHIYFYKWRNKQEVHSSLYNFMKWFKTIRKVNISLIPIWVL